MTQLGHWHRIDIPIQEPYPKFLSVGHLRGGIAWPAMYSFRARARTRRTADAACAVLEATAIRCWIAPRDIRAGAEYAASIIEGIDSCRIMVLIFSSNANASQQIHREIERAVSKGLTIIPFRIEEIAPTKAMEYYLGSIYWLDAITPPLAQHLRHLVEQVKANLQVDPAISATSFAVFPKTAPNRISAFKRPKMWSLVGGLVVVVLIGAGALAMWNSPTVLTRLVGDSTRLSDSSAPTGQAIEAMPAEQLLGKYIQIRGSVTVESQPIDGGAHLTETHYQERIIYISTKGRIFARGAFVNEHDSTIREQYPNKSNEDDIKYRWQENGLIGASTSTQSTISFDPSFQTCTASSVLKPTAIGWDANHKLRRILNVTMNSVTCSIHDGNPFGDQ